ncbi:uncharacterized protein G2W53_041364 [Senna tora]|uniref:Uncharacterized protein n=1 Tax=Senna tora TaxID=362788 RepID=A0A834SEQ1_9FABA|nr:uncharacterized protein G2W53_041364 [Senna tora]
MIDEVGTSNVVPNPRNNKVDMGELDNVDVPEDSPM